MLRRLLLGTAFYAFTLVTTCVFQATGKAVGAFVLSISGQGVIYGLVIWALSSIWGYDGVIVTQPWQMCSLVCWQWCCISPPFIGSFAKAWRNKINCKSCIYILLIIY